MPSLSAVILRGTRAGQPAANAVAEGSLYYVTDENKTERSNGSTWDTYNDASGAGTDHGLLTGLSDDDHPQYLLTSDAGSRAEFATSFDSIEANTTQEPWEFILPGTGISVTIEGDSGSAVRLAVDSSVVVTTDSANWVDLTDGGTTTLHSHSGGSYDSTVPSSQSDFVEASDTNESITDLVYAGSNITITELGTRGAISIASSGSTLGSLLNYTYAELTADQTKNANITFADLTGLSFSIAASEVWIAEFNCFYRSEIGADIKFGMTWPTGCTVDCSVVGPATAIAGDANEASGRWQVIRPAASGDLIAVAGGNNNGGSNNPLMAQLICRIKNSSTAGTIQLTFAQFSSNATNTTIFGASGTTACSFMEARRVL